MENHKLVLPEHLNHFGYLFGGNLLKWVDEFAWIAASLDYPGCHFVTIAMDNVEFRKSVKEGSILKFSAKMNKEGSTSVQYSVSVFRGNFEDHEEDLIFSTHVTFVRINEEGSKLPIPK
jgi:acyl-CoA hydrolase